MVEEEKEARFRPVKGERVTETVVSDKVFRQCDAGSGDPLIRPWICTRSKCTRARLKPSQDRSWHVSPGTRVAASLNVNVCFSKRLTYGADAGTIKFRYDK